MKKLTKNIYIALGLVFSVLITGSYFMVSNSYAFKYSEKLIRNSELINNKFGEIEKVRLVPFKYSMSSSGIKERAEFKVKIYGEKRDGVLTIKLNSDTGIWYVVNASLDNEQIVL